MGCRKLSYYEQEALNENCKIFELGLEKTASGSIFCKDYYAFGSLMPNRYFSSAAYRYGFQGQEMTNELKNSTGTSYDFKFRSYDARLGRFASIDPLSKSYPFYSPYSFSGNRVIDAFELEGMEPIVLHGRIIAYKVQNEQGPTQIAQDINNPKTQKKYGYNLIGISSWKDVVSDNIKKFKKDADIADINDVNDPGYWKSNINTGEILVINNQGYKFDQLNKKIEQINVKIRDINDAVKTLNEEIEDLNHQVNYKNAWKDNYNSIKADPFDRTAGTQTYIDLAAGMHEMRLNNEIGLIKQQIFLRLLKINSAKNKINQLNKEKNNNKDKQTEIRSKYKGRNKDKNTENAVRNKKEGDTGRVGGKGAKF